MSRGRVDLVALVAAVLALVMLFVYLWIIMRQGSNPVYWFVGALLVGAATAGYGVATVSSHRAAALFLAGFVLFVAGVLAIWSIGFPILLAGSLCFFAAARSRRTSSAAHR